MERRSQLLAKARTVAGSTWFWGGVVFAVTWGGGIVAPFTPSIDHSTQAGLNLAAEQGLDFGPDVVFSYGPLGFLKSYLIFYVWPARLAALYGIALHLSLSLSLVWAARRNFALPVAVALAAVAAVLMRGDLAAAAVRDDAGVVVLAFIWCVAALGDESPAWVRRLVVYGGGPFAALELLAKANTGIVVLALVAITAIALEGDRRRNLVAVASSFVAALAVLWFAAGQGLGDVGSFVRGTYEIAAGYSSSARVEFGTRDYDYLLGPLVIAVAAAIGWISTAGTPWRRRGPILAALGLVLFTSFKTGFVAHEILHMATFYATILGACLAFRLPPAAWARIGGLVATVGVAAAAFTTDFPFYPLDNPVENVRNGAGTVARLVDTGRLEDEISDGRADLVARFAVDPASLELLEGHTVHVDPSETSAVWAHELDWRPLPVFQPYAAWTPELDERNAEMVASDADGPDRILRQNLNALGRYPGFESPLAMVEMLCNFHDLRTTPAWQVLGRVPDRCGEPRPLGTAEGSYGAPIAVPLAPGPDDLVFARVEGVEVSGFERLMTLLYRSRERSISFDGGDDYVLMPETAADGLLLRAPPRIDFPAPFALAPNADEVTFLLDGGAADAPITLEFFSMEVRR